MQEERWTYINIKAINGTGTGMRNPFFGKDIVKAKSGYIQSYQPKPKSPEKIQAAPRSLNEFFNSLTAVSTSSKVKAETAQRACFCANWTELSSMPWDG